MKLILSLFFTTLLFCSCKNELEPQDSSGTNTPPVAEATPTTEASPTMPAAAPQSTVATTQPTVDAKPATPTMTAPGMNPPHGQPNHRCDIKVGEPLNSPPGKTASTPMKKVAEFNPASQPATATITPAAKQSSPAITTSQSSQSIATPAILDLGKAPAATAPGMNPPHGQDGHRCDVAVGAPLPR